MCEFCDEKRQREERGAAQPLLDPARLELLRGRPYGGHADIFAWWAAVDEIVARDGLGPGVRIGPFEPAEIDSVHPSELQPIAGGGPICPLCDPPRA